MLRFFALKQQILLLHEPLKKSKVEKLKKNMVHTYFIACVDILVKSLSILAWVEGEEEKNRRLEKMSQGIYIL